MGESEFSNILEKYGFLDGMSTKISQEIILVSANEHETVYRHQVSEHCAGGTSVMSSSELKTLKTFTIEICSVTFWKW